MAGALPKRQYLLGLASLMGVKLATALMKKRMSALESAIVPNSIRDFLGGGGSGRLTLSSKTGASTVPPRGRSRSGGDCSLFGWWNLDCGTLRGVGGGE